MEDRKPKISVIIPCYNQSQYIDDAVESVLNQSFKDYEIIIIDDDSTDELTKVKLEKYNIPIKKLFHSVNKGVSAARNTGIMASSGEYILPLDADDKIGSKYLEEACRVLDTNKGIGIVYCQTEFFGDKTGKWIQKDFSIEKMLTMNMIINCAMFRKIDFLKTKGFNENMKYGWEDWDFWLSMLENKIGVFKLPDVHFFYRIKSKDSRNQDFQLDPEKRNYLLKTIFLNHIDLYLEIFGNPIDTYSNLNRIVQSKDYKLGKLIINPFRRLKRFLKK